MGQPLLVGGGGSTGATGLIVKAISERTQLMVKLSVSSFRFPKDPEGNARLVVGAVLLSFLAIGAIFVLHPVLGVRDVDGYAYIIGARSLHEGNGYRSLMGEPLNHWPPGYSLMLSLFPDTILAATVVNYCSYGATVGLLFYLLRQSGWTWQAAGGLSIGLGSGFFRLLANNAHADIFTYALFLAAIYAASQSRRLLPSLIWALLIPVKFIAVAFLPPALGADIIVARRGWYPLVYAYVPGVAASIVCVAGILIFNRLTLHDWMSSSLVESSFQSLLSNVKDFTISIPREFLFSWHGSIAAPLTLMAFFACMLLSAICLLSLRPAPERNWFTVYGMLFFVCSGLLLVVRDYSLNVRLLGYGLIALFLGCRPGRWANPIWLLYGFASLAVGVVNATTVNSLGSMDPRYAGLAAQVYAYYNGAKIVATNSFHILDLRANIPSVPVSNYGEAAKYETFLWVTLPRYDLGSEAVTIVAHPGPDWCEQKQFVGGALFARCEASGRLPD